MADNAVLNSGSGGITLALDDVASVWYQRVKLTDGTADATTPIIAGGGAEAAGALLVTLANDSTGLLSVDDNGGALTVDWAGTAPPIGAGTEAAALRVTLATDSTGQVTIDGTVTANLSATDNAVLDTIDTAIDAINAKLVTGTVIGDVNLGATDNAVLDAIAASVAGTVTVDWGGTVPPIGAGTEAAALRVTVATDSTGVLTVDGTVTANLSATDNAVLDTINTAVVATQAAVEGTLTVGSHAVTNAGTFATQIDGAALTALQLIDNIVSGSEAQVDVVAALPAGTNLIGDVGLGVRTSGGCSIFRSIDLDEGALEVVKGSAGQIYHIAAFNSTAAPLFVKIYNATSGTIGTGTPVLTYMVPANADSDGAGFILSVPQGIAFATGISVGCSTAIADADTGAPGANACSINILYA